MNGKCPLCNSDAYIGFSSVKCVNQKCENFVFKDSPIKFKNPVTYKFIDGKWWISWVWELPDTVNEDESSLKRD